MKKTVAIICFILALTPAAKSQKAAKSVYFELGGPGLASVNYDMRFQSKEDGLGFRVGVGGFGIEDASILFIPVGLNYLLGKDGKNYFEVGGGITAVSGNDGSNDGTFSTSFGHLNFGYRLQPADGGFLFRAGIVPIFNKEGFVPYYAGISFGYKF
ncbi:hypothetical protein [Segetibacter sp.]|jgi:hypothetical protein|uniref:hypothetical protein n=1 Tax=Segetibacter sp. TaxID=2231182 RepID=UPI00261A7C33|nr:hypothetical protein [Segetibacter sp.]MCW3082611.1 hypothetical protein [Segetibacter sp.]